MGFWHKTRELQLLEGTAKQNKHKANKYTERIQGQGPGGP